MVKMEIRRNSIFYSAKKKKSQIAEQQRLEEEITLLDSNVNKTEQQYNRLYQCKNILQDIFL
jgi:hypothetical protein